MDATDTLSGLYGPAKVTMPDGSEIVALARRVPRGDGTLEWALVDNRTTELEARFANTDLRPHDHAPVSTTALDKNEPGDPPGTTQRHVCADLIQFLGDPDRIVADKGLDPERLQHMKLHPASLTLARRLCQLAGPMWQEALRYLPKPCNSTH